MIKRYRNKTIKRKTKVRAKLKRFSDRPRLSVFRSNKYIYSQIIDDKKGETLVSASEKELKKLQNSPPAEAQHVRAGKTPKLQTKIDRAYLIGQILAKKALKKKIKQVYFDRGKHKYHGRVEALAKGAREGGLEF